MTGDKKYTVDHQNRSSSRRVYMHQYSCYDALQRHWIGKNSLLYILSHTLASTSECNWGYGLPTEIGIVSQERSHPS